MNMPHGKNKAGTAARIAANWRIFVLVWLLLVQPSPSWAQSQQTPEEFAASATAVDAAALLTGKSMVRLWGIEKAEAPGTTLGIVGRTNLDDLIGGQTVRCKVLSWDDRQPVARCLNAGETDLGIAMLEKGYAVVDRPAVRGSVFEEPYFKAEARARSLGQGVWNLAGAGANGAMGGQSLIFTTLIYVALGVSPLAGFAMVALVNARGFKKLTELHRHQMERLLNREENLREREKYVVAAMLESELNANKIKLEAFLVVYEEMLKALREPGKEHKYRQTGEIVHEQPRLARAVFDSNISRLELLEPQLAAEISGLYAKVHPNPDYITLEPGTPVSEALYQVEKVIADASNLVRPMDRILAALGIILRNKTSAAAAPITARKTPPGAFQRKRA